MSDYSPHDNTKPNISESDRPPAANAAARPEPTPSPAARLAKKLREARPLVEAATVREMLRLLRAPEVLAEAVRAVRAEASDACERAVLEALHGFWDLWGQLIPAEQARIVRLMVERVVVTAGALQVSLRVAGLSAIAREMLAGSKEQEPA